MKLNSFISILLVMLSGYLYPQECSGRLNITVEPDSAVIFLNGVQSAEGMLDTVLNEGEYKVFISLQPEVYNSSSVRDSVLIKCGEIIQKRYELHKGVLVRTEPDNAVLYIDGDLAGYTPLYIDTYSGNAELRKEGYKSLAISVNNLRDRKIIELEGIVSRNSKSFVQTNLFKILVGAILISGGSAAYFKLEADDKFDSYRRTGDPELLDQTERYDLISGISFGVLQINFGLLIYNFLIE